jgi:hypothetical protein
VSPKSPNALALPDELSGDAFRERLTELALAARADDRKAKDLHAFCAAHPEAWSRFGSLETDVIAGWLQRLAPETPGSIHRSAWNRERIDRELRERRTKLRADGNSELENLLINRILAAWLMTMDAEATYTRVLRRDATFKEVQHYQKAVESASKQLLRAVEALARVRRLLPATTQASPAETPVVVPS